MFERNALTYLRQWRNRTDRKPLILRGARQVGKTTIVTAFANEFSNYVYLNLELAEDQRIFNTDLDIARVLQAISVVKHAQVNQDTLLFIDEIQNSSVAVQSLRYFYEQHPEICVIAAGSLLENYAGIAFSFPVGRVEYYAMRPCTFYEYMAAIGETEDLETIKAQQTDFIHDRLMRHFQTYTLLGGMPEVIQKYIVSRDLHSVESVYQTLLISYRNDVEKYAQNKTQAQVIRHILQYGWALAGEIITYVRFAGSNYRSREVNEAFITLQKSMLLETVYPTSSVVLPLLPTMSRHPKLLWLDTGLVNYQAGVREAVFSADNIQDVYRGRIAEHIVGQELIGNNGRIDSHRSFWSKGEKSQAEVDYVVQYNGYLIPVEVKSGSNAHLKSLHQFMALAPTSVAVRVWNKPFSVDVVTNPLTGKEFRLLNIPFYMVGMLEHILKEYF